MHEYFRENNVERDVILNLIVPKAGHLSNLTSHRVKKYKMN